MKKISVVVAVYNVAPYLEKCLDSLIHQTLKNIEIIVINDASEDCSYEIMKRFAQKDKRIRIFNNKQNKKVAFVRNLGIDKSHGEYISFIDGDDFLDIDFYEKLYNLAQKKSADIAKGITQTIEYDGSTQLASDNNKIRKNGKFYFFGHLLTGIYRKDLIQKHRIRFKIDFFCFQTQVVYWANKVVCDDTALYHYVRHKNSCDSAIFSLEKWQRLNLGHGNFIYNWVTSHPYPDEIQNFYLERIKALYFYGFNKLAPKDILIGSEILAKNIIHNCHCGFDIKNFKKLRRSLFKRNPKVSRLRYLYYKIRRKV